MGSNAITTHICIPNITSSPDSLLIYMGVQKALGSLISEIMCALPDLVNEGTTHDMDVYRLRNV